ncbi:MAG TPA: secretin N-terminal domain-containing protein [Vicinamibacterales bacterium]|nr:secretin N-terminal domain-containing protein [Vicinamibacterales bacterium]
MKLIVVMALALAAAGCGASRSYNRAENSARQGDWDAAVEYYRRAVQQSPERSDYKIALERAMINASHQHLNQAQLAEARGELEEALREYRRASDFDPPNRQLAAKVMEIERRIREQYESRPANNIAQLREQARQAGPPPLIKLNEVLPEIRFNNTSIRDILNTIANITGINITYDRDYQDRAYTVLLTGVTLDQALNQILSANQLFYKVLNQNTIMVIPDTAQKRANYEEQVIRTFYVSHADATELAQIINQIIRVPAMAVQPMIAPNKTNNTITIRATTAVAAIIEKMIESNDKPRAEIVIDVQILEVSRERAKQFGLDLSNYQINAIFSPESDPRGTTGGTTPTATLNTTPSFNLNTVTRGVSTADFYLAVPSAVIRFLETDSDTKLVAKPQLRGAEGQKITLNLGDDIPIPSTVFTPLATGGANTNPLTSFNYRTVGIVVEMTPRVTIEGDVILDLSVENSTKGVDVNVAGSNLPSFGTRKVVTRLRLRDGEANLLAGLLREDERRTLRGVPGVLRLPIVNKLFASNDTDIRTTDIVMLLTPRIVRTQEITASDLSPIFIGTQQNLGLNGPPPLIAAPAEPAPGAPAAPAAPGAVTPAQPAPAPAPAPVQPGAPNAPPGGAANAAPGVSIVPPGSSPIPGTTAVTAAPTPSASAPAVAPAGAQLIVTPPGTDFRVGAGPYTVAISATNASRLSGMSLTMTFNPAALRVRAVQEGSFMRAGGAQATFTQMVDASIGRIDIAIVRTGDATGVAGTGLLAAVVFDAVGGGSANLAITGTATAPGGSAASLQVSPVPAVTVR